MIVLKKDGFYKYSDDLSDEGLKNDLPRKLELYESYEDQMKFMCSWKDIITVDEDVTCKDLFMILEKMDETLLEIISCLTNSNIVRNLDSWRDPIEDGYVDDCELTSVELYKIFEIENFDVELGYGVSFYPACHGVGKVWDDINVTSGLSEDEKKTCNSYALEYTSWNKLKHLKIKIAEKSKMSKMVWKKCEPRKLFEGITKTDGTPLDDDWGTIDVEVDRDASTPSEDVICSFSLGDFFNAITSELCFFSSQESREKENDVIRDRVDEVEEELRTSSLNSDKV